MAFSLPIDLPMNLEGYQFEISLPISLPMSITSHELVSGCKLITIKCNVNLQPYYGTIKLPHIIIPTGKLTKIPFKETAWFFPGLFLEENVISTMNADMNLVENIQSLILADFELQSSNVVKVSWYGNTAPGVIIMKKSTADDVYVEDGTYSWDEGSAIVNIAGEDYNIYLRGTSNSGSSDIYTIGASMSTLIDPTIAIPLNEKIYVFDINYTSVYHVSVNY